MSFVISESPSARKPQGKHAPKPSPSMLAKRQGGLVRTWLENNTGLACIALGWAFAFAAIAASPDAPFPEEYDPAFGLFVCAIALISFGVGWMFRDERDAK